MSNCAGPDCGHPSHEEKKGPSPDDVARAKEQAAKQAEEKIRAELKEAIDKGKIHVDDFSEPGKIRYVVARYTHDETEALIIADRMEMAHLFEEIKQACFVNGMVDGITQYRNVIEQKAELTKAFALRIAYKGAFKLGTDLLNLLNQEKKKVSSFFVPPEEEETEEKQNPSDTKV